MLCKRLLVFVSALFARQQQQSPLLAAVTCAHAVNPNGRWTVVQSNDFLMPEGVTLEIAGGRFRVHNVVSGSFEFDASRACEGGGVFVRVCPFDVGLLTRHYEMLALGDDRVRVFDDRRSYVIRRWG